jgi:hypothetical protein
MKERWEGGKETADIQIRLEILLNWEISISPAAAAAVSFPLPLGRPPARPGAGWFVRPSVTLGSRCKSCFTSWLGAAEEGRKEGKREEGRRRRRRDSSGPSVHFCCLLLLLLRCCGVQPAAAAAADQLA